MSETYLDRLPSRAARSVQRPSAAQTEPVDSHRGQHPGLLQLASLDLGSRARHAVSIQRFVGNATADAKLAPVQRQQTPPEGPQKQNGSFWEGFWGQLKQQFTSLGAAESAQADAMLDAVLHWAEQQTGEPVKDVLGLRAVVHGQLVGLLLTAKVLTPGELLEAYGPAILDTIRGARSWLPAGPLLETLVDRDPRPASPYWIGVDAGQDVGALFQPAQRAWEIGQRIGRDLTAKAKDAFNPTTPEPAAP